MNDLSVKPIIVMVLASIIFACPPTHSYKTDKLNSKNRMERAYAEYLKKNFSKAAKEFVVIADSQPDNFNANFLSGMSLFKSEQYRDAPKYFIQAAKINPNMRLNCYLLAGICYKKSSQYSRAISLLRKVVNQADSEKIKNIALVHLLPICLNMYNTLSCILIMFVALLLMAIFGRKKIPCNRKFDVNWWAFFFGIPWYFFNKVWQRGSILIGLLSFSFIWFKYIFPMFIRYTLFFKDVYEQLILNDSSHTEAFISSSMYMLFMIHLYSFIYGKRDLWLTKSLEEPRENRISSDIIDPLLRRKKDEPKSETRNKKKVGFEKYFLSSICTIMSFILQAGAIAVIFKNCQSIGKSKPIVPFSYIIMFAAILFGTGRVIKNYGLRHVKTEYIEDGCDKPLILLLRSFIDDKMGYFNVSSALRADVMKLGFKDKLNPYSFARYGGLSFEMRIVNELKNYAIPIAIGQPDEDLPPLGADRLYVDKDEEWQDVVLKYINKAKVLNIILSRGEGFGWELENIFNGAYTDKIIMSIPPIDDNELRIRWHFFVERIYRTGINVVVPPEFSIVNNIVIIYFTQLENVVYCCPIKGRRVAKQNYDKAFEQFFYHPFPQKIIEKGLYANQKSDLKFIKYHGADLRGVNFRGVNLHGADFRESNLQSVDFQLANLSHADLRRTDLRMTNLEGANLHKAKLQKANLEKANLTGATFGASEDQILHQLSQAKSLYKTTFDREILYKLTEKHPNLFKEPRHNKNR